jgi:hypothetical protein
MTSTRPRRGKYDSPASAGPLAGAGPTTTERSLTMNFGVLATRARG